jgi:sporulation protein YlmC with PRC-barrel domain
MSTLGDNDEEQAEKQEDARAPQVRHGGGAGRRADPGAKPLIALDGLASGLRADQIIGSEVRTSDDKIVGEVRNVVFGTKDGRDFVIVASGGFFTPGTASIVVPLKAMRVSQDRTSYFLPMAESGLKAVPAMPDQEYKWLADRSWRTRNEAAFARP